MDEAMHRLYSVVAPPAFWQWTRPRQPFRGYVRDDTFSIYRIIGYRNSFRPRVSGRIVPGPSGTSIECTMTMEPFIQVFMALWLSVAASVFVAFGIAALRDNQFGADMGVIPFLFLPFSVAVCTFGFWLEARKTKRALHELFDAAP